MKPTYLLVTLTLYLAGMSGWIRIKALRKSLLALLVILSLLGLSGTELYSQDKGDDGPVGEKPIGDKPAETTGRGRHNDPLVAALLGLIPGAGQLYNRNYLDAGTQFFIYNLASGIHSEFARRDEYIPHEERTVEFNFEDAVIGYLVRKNGFAYGDIPYRLIQNDFPWFGETAFERQIRLLGEGRVAEENPLVKYGSYGRMNTTTMSADMASQMALATMFYSSYSAYRDAGGIPGREEETIKDLAIAPFQPEFFFSQRVLIPLGLLALFEAATRKLQRPTLVNPGTKREGIFYTTYTSFNAGVFEEAFFRGFMNDVLSKRIGNIPGGTVSGLVFGLAHLEGGNSAISVLPQIGIGFYFAYLQYLNGGDIRQGIALHFWWDVIALAVEVASYRVDRQVDKNQREVHFMPISYTLKF